MRTPLSSWSLAVMFLTHDWQLIPEMWREQIWTGNSHTGVEFVISVIISVIVSVIVSVIISIIISVIISTSIISVIPIFILKSCMRRYL